MFKTLIYNGRTYNQFIIDENGVVKNLKTGHIYHHSIGKSGYIIITLPMGKRGAVKSIRVHKAVAETLLPNPKKLPIVHHKDENKQNPKLENLEWVDKKLNV